MELHKTHLLSSNSSEEHPYKFDKKGNIISDSVNNHASIKEAIKIKKRIKTSEIFQEMKKSQDNIIDIMEEENSSFIQNILKKKNLPINKIINLNNKYSKGKNNLKQYSNMDFDRVNQIQKKYDNLDIIKNDSFETKQNDSIIKYKCLFNIIKNNIFFCSKIIIKNRDNDRNKNDENILLLSSKNIREKKKNKDRIINKKFRFIKNRGSITEKINAKKKSDYNKEDYEKSLIQTDNITKNSIKNLKIIKNKDKVKSETKKKYFKKVFQNNRNIKEYINKTIKTNNNNQNYLKENLKKFEKNKCKKSKSFEKNQQLKKIEKRPKNESLIKNYKSLSKKSNRTFITPNSKKINKHLYSSEKTNIYEEILKLNNISNPLFKNEKLFIINKLSINQLINEEKKNRSIRDINIIENECHHDLLNSKIRKKYTKHFGNEEKCPICCAMYEKNKILENKRKNLSNFCKNFHKQEIENKNEKSYSKISLHKNFQTNETEAQIYIKNLYKKMRAKKRTQSVKEIRKKKIKNEIKKNYNDKKFPIIYHYFYDFS